MHSLQYFMDIGNATVYNTPISFSQKYEGLEHYQQILDDQTKF